MTTPIERAFLFLEDIEHNKQQWLNAGHTLHSSSDKQTLMAPIYADHFSSEFNHLAAQDRPTHTLYQLFGSGALANIEYVRTQYGTQSKIAAIEPNQVTVVDLSLDLVFNEIYDSRPRRRIRKQYFSLQKAISSFLQKSRSSSLTETISSFFTDKQYFALRKTT